MNKRMKRLLLVVFVLLLIITVIILTSDNNGSTININLSKSAKEMAKKESEILNTKVEIDENNTERLKSINIITEFFNYINDKKYSKAYAMMDKEYIETFGLSEEDFKLKYNYRDEKVVIVRECEVLENRIYLGITLKNKNQNSPGGMNLKFTIVDQSGDYKIIDNDIVSIESLEYSKDIQDEINIKIDRKVRTLNDACFYRISIENYTDHEIELDNGSFKGYLKEVEYQPSLPMGETFVLPSHKNKKIYLIKYISQVDKITVSINKEEISIYQ